MNIWEKQKEIYRVLNENKNLNDMVSGIYSWVPQGSTFPYIVLGDISCMVINGIESVLFPIRIYSEYHGTKEVNQIIQTIRNTLSNAEISFYSYKISHIDELNFAGEVVFRFLLAEDATTANSLLKIKQGDEFVTIGGIKIDELRISNNLHENTNISSGKWRSISSSNAMSSITISGTGIYTEYANIILQQALMAGLAEYQIILGNKEYFQGNFAIRNYKRNLIPQELYYITLESSGEILHSRNSTK